MEIMIGDFTSWKKFSEYIEAKYLPLIKELYENKALSLEQKYVLDYLHDDLVSIVNNSEELDKRMNIKKEK